MPAAVARRQACSTSRPARVARVLGSSRAARFPPGSLMPGGVAQVRFVNDWLSIQRQHLLEWDAKVDWTERRSDQVTHHPWLVPVMQPGCVDRLRATAARCSMQSHTLGWYVQGDPRLPTHALPAAGDLCQVRAAARAGQREPAGPGLPEHHHAQRRPVFPTGAGASAAATALPSGGPPAS